MIARKLPASFFAWFMFLCLIATLVAVFLVALPCAHGQTIDSSIHVKAYPGNDVGTKVTNAMVNCDPTLPCILVIDPSLANLAAGTMPALCATCSLADYRGGSPQAQGMTCTGAGASRTCGSPQKITLSTGGTPRAGLDTVLTTTPTTRNIVVLNYFPGTQALTVTFSASLPVGPYPYTFSGLTNVTSLNGQILTPSTVSGSNATFTFNTGTGGLHDASDTGSASIAVPGSTGYLEVDDGAGANSNGPLRAHDLTLSGPGCGAGTYAKADGSGCGSAVSAGVSAFNARTGTVVPVASDYAPVLGSNSLPPTSHFNMPTPTFYFPLLQTSNCSSSSGVSNAAAGIVATTAGVSGTCTINLPSAIDPTQPFRFAVAILGPDGVNTTTIQLLNSNGTSPQIGVKYFFNPTLIGDAGLFAGAQWSVNNSITSIPNGTQWAVGIIGDGNSVTSTLAPVPLTTLYGNCETFQGAYNGGLCAGSMGAKYLDSTYGAVTSGWNQILITTSSTANVIEGLYLSQGFIGAPTDGLLNLPAAMIVNTGLSNYPLKNSAQSRITAGGAGNLIFLSGTYGSPNGTPIVFFHHPNAYYNIEVPAYTSAAAFLNAGYSVIGSQETAPSLCAANSDAICSNWGAPPGMLTRKKLVDYVRANLPAHTQLFHLGMSMGLLNALDYEWMYPGSAGIIGISGVSGMAQAWNQSGGFSSQSPAINTGYGDLYLSIQAGTGHTPSSSPTYWSKFAPSTVTPGENYLLTPPFTWKGIYAGGTAYATGQTVSVSRTDVTFPSALNVFDPYQNPGRYAKVPILLSYCDPTVSPGDTTLDPHQNLNFNTVVTAAGGSVTLLPSLNSGCTHLSSDQFVPSTFVNFFNTYVAAASAAQFGNTPPVQSTGCSFPSTCIAPSTTILHSNSSALSNSSFVPVLTILPSLAPGQNVSVACQLFYQTNNASNGISLQISGQNGSSTLGSATFQTNLSAGTSTNFDAIGTAASGTLTFTGPASVTTANNSYVATLNAVINNGTSAGAPLVLAAETNGGGATSTIRANSKCTVSPAQ